MKRLLLLASAVLLSLAATPSFANGADRLPHPLPDPYALGPQATLASAPPRLPSAPSGMGMRPAPISDARAAAPLSASAGPPLKVASIGGVRSSGAAGAAPPDRSVASADALGERLPSTPVALATLLLLICILIGRRNRAERM